MDALLAHTFQGVDPLREQWAHARVHSSCECGCGSIGFAFDDKAQLPPSVAQSPLPVEGELLDERGEVLGGVIVLLSDGFLDDVDVHSYGAEPLPLPTLGSVRWRWRT